MQARRRVGVTPRFAEVDNRDRDISITCAMHEPQARENGERTSDHDERGCLVDDVVSRVDCCLGNVLAEEDDVRFHCSTTSVARWNHEVVKQLVGQERVTVRRELVSPVSQVRIELKKFTLNGVARFDHAAREAARLFECAVQLNDCRVPRPPMQAVDILGDEAGQRPFGF